jgi:hypothetical protein
MQPLDLTKQAPRGPRAPLGNLDLVLAARTVDKLRATLPGGNIGDYQITGFTSRLINRLGIVEHQLRAVIARAESDQEIADWIAAHSDPSRYPEINAEFERQTVGERLGDAAFLERYPSARNLPPQTSRLDHLAIDDAEAFGEKA